MCETRKTPSDLPLDAVAQALGLDPFAYQVADVLRMISALQDSEQKAGERELALRQAGAPNNGQYLRQLIDTAKAYNLVALRSIARNDHMNALTPATQPSAEQVAAVLVDFLNYVGMVRCLDLGLYTSDLAIPAAASQEMEVARG